MKDKLGISYDDIYKELYDLLNGVQQISEELEMMHGFVITVLNLMEKQK